MEHAITTFRQLYFACKEANKKFMKQLWITKHPEGNIQSITSDYRQRKVLMQ